MRNTSPVASATIRRWRQLFGFTHEEAEAEIKRYRSHYRRDINRESYESLWTWENMQNLGFDRESYNYWLDLWSHSDCTMDVPLDAKDWIRHIQGVYIIFIFQDVDEVVNRLQYAPLSRVPQVHTVHDWKGFPRKAVILREDEEWEMIRSLPRYIRQGETVHFAGQSDVIPMN